MSSTSTVKPDPSVAARVAGEDIACGDFVGVLTETIEVPSYFWDCSDVTMTPGEMIRFKLLPQDSGAPLKVIAVCLPFVYATDAHGKAVTLDTRRVQLVRIDRQCAKTVCKAIRGKKASRDRDKSARRRKR